MAISEKTVELNLSRVVVEKCRRQHQVPGFAVGFTQAQEAALGVDAQLAAPGWNGGFIQYKALHVQKSGALRWNLNRTKNKDQHSLLCGLEAMGHPVFYCFPEFDSYSPLKEWSPPSLWAQVKWVRPLAISVPQPVDAHHHVEYYGPKIGWKVSSDEPVPIPERAFASFDEVQKALLGTPLAGAIDRVFEHFGFSKRGLTELVDVDDSALPHDVEERLARLADATRGLNLMVFGPPNK